MPATITKILRVSFYFLAIALLIAISAQSAVAGKRFESRYPCRQERKVCIDSGTKIIEEEAVHKDCWKYSYVTVCDYPSKDDCARLSHCYFVQIVNCLLTDSYGNCVNQKKEFSCKRWVAHTIEERKVRTDLIEKEGQEGLICKGLPCIDGNCFDKAYKTNGQMMDSISKLYAAGQMKGGKDLNFKLFEGTNQQCSKKATSYSNCCSENLPGWGRNVGAGCTQDERTLIQNRKKNLCVYVGKQNKQTMGVTTVVKHQFCCFGDILGKVIQVEGRKQLNGRQENNFGSGGSPDCRGLTLEEIQRIDFSRLDFSEFIEDFKVKFFGSYKQPNSADITSRVNGSMSNIKRYDENPINPKNNLTGWNLGLKDDSFEAEEERRLELERQRREAERLENERRRQLEESEEYKRRLAEEQRRKAEQEAEAKRLLAIEEAKEAERRIREAEVEKVEEVIKLAESTSKEVLMTHELLWSSNSIETTLWLTYQHLNREIFSFPHNIQYLEGEALEKKITDFKNQIIQSQERNKLYGTDYLDQMIQNRITGWNLRLRDDPFEAENERRREAERLENERRRQLEESEEYKRLLTVEEAKKAKRRKQLEAELAEAIKENVRINKYQIPVQAGWAMGHYNGFNNYESIMNMWHDYKLISYFCDPESFFWQDPTTGYINKWRWFFRGKISYWCKNRETIQKIENDLRSGNY